MFSLDPRRRAAVIPMLAAASLAGCGGDGPAEEAAGERSPDFAYEVEALSRRPELSNRGEIEDVMEEHYPRSLQNAGVGGTVLTRFVIEPDGTVDMGTAKVLQTSHEQLSEATLKTVERFRFRPGRYEGEDVRVVVEMPVTWRPAG